MKNALLTLAVVAVGMLLASPSAHAAGTNGTWANTGTDWNTSTDWSNNIPPTAGGIAYFTGAEITDPNISSSVSIAQLNFAASATGYTLSSSDTNTTLTLTDIGTGSTGAIDDLTTSGTTIVSAPIILGGAAGSTQEFNQVVGGTLAINGTVSDGGNGVALLLETGAFTMTGANTYSGGTSLSGSSSSVTVTSLGNAGSSGNLGTGAISFDGEGTLIYTGSGETSNKALILSSTSTSAGGQAITTSGSLGALTLSGGISSVAKATQTLTINGSTTYNTALSGNISDGTAGGATALVLKTGILTLSGSNNTFSGGVKVYGLTTLNIGNASALGTGLLFFNGANSTIDNISGNSSITLGINAETWGGAFTFTGTNSLNLGTGAVNITSSSQTVTVAANTLTVGGVIGSTAGDGFIKAGAGTLVLSGQNTYTGATAVNAGTLNVSGSVASSSSTAVSGTGILTGTGTASAITLANTATANITPGTAGTATGMLSAPSFTWTGSATKNSTTGSTLTFTLSGMGNTSNQLNLTGAFNEGSGTENAFDFNLSGGVAGDTYTLIDFGSTNFTSAADFVDTSTTTLGTFNLTGDSVTFTATSVEAVPEPKVWLMMLGGLALLAFRQRRRIQG